MIGGVIINKLITHGENRGFFREIFRFPEKFRNAPVGQISHSFVNEGVLKAWHSHKYQHQWNYVVCGQIKVVLIDYRKESDTFREKIEFLAGEKDNPISYYFPPGVLHGYKCTTGPMQIIYLTSGIYDLDDEIRTPREEIDEIYKWI